MTTEYGAGTVDPDGTVIKVDPIHSLKAAEALVAGRKFMVNSALNVKVVSREPGGTWQVAS